MNPSSMLSNRTEEDSSRRKVLQDIADSGVSAKSKFQYLALVLNCVLVNEELTPVVELPDFVGQFRPLCLDFPCGAVVRPSWNFDPCSIRFHYRYFSDILILSCEDFRHTMTVTLTVRARPNESRTLELQTERYCLELSKYKFGVIKYKVLKDQLMMLLLEMFLAHKRRVAYKSELRRFKIAEIRAQVAALKLANMGGIGGTRVVHSRPSSPTTPADAPERGRERRDRGKGDRGGRGGAGGGLETAGKATRPSSSTSRPAAFGIRLPSAYDVHAPTHEANQHLSYQEFKGLYEYN